MIWLELFILLGCILIGSRLGGIGMGAMGGFGLVVFVFVLGMPPGGPPVVILGMILTVITALAAMEAAGGLDYLVGLAEKILRKNPKRITFVAPLVTFFLILISGTQHVIYALLPVISEISRKSNIRPERPLSISVIASMFGLIASPISAVTVALVSTMISREVTIGQIISVTIPAGLIGTLVGAAFVYKRGKDLDKDDDWIAKQKEMQEVESKSTVQSLSGIELRNAKGSFFFFFLAVILIVFLGLFPDLRPDYHVEGVGENQVDRLDMAVAIMIIMLAVSAVIMLVFKGNANKAVSGPIMKSGVIAVVSILGISWLGSSFFIGNEHMIIDGLSAVISGNEWIFGIGLFILSVLLFSQAATVVTLVPIALSLNMSTEMLLAIFPAVNGLFFLPTYGTILAAVSFDQTGTTKIGKFLVNHSFMLPGLVTMFASLLTSFLLIYFIY